MRLRRVDCSGTGLRRKRRGRGFEYRYQDSGERVTDPDVLARVKKLAIPPAWQDVWICPHPNGHIQAVGTDAAGRKQYIYHEKWRARRDAEKFERMLEFARALPSMRRVCALDIARKDMDRARVLACAVRLLDHGFFRIGTESYAEKNRTYGLATMLKSHVTLKGEIITFDYTAKSGKRRIQSLVDAEVFEVVSRLKRRRSGPPDLLAYREAGVWRDVKSSDINDYIHEAADGDFTAKDFRTWNATVLAALALSVSGGAAGSKTARNRAEARVVKEVAHYLGNTPAVCRNSYIDPRVFDRYRSGWTIGGIHESLGEEISFGSLSIQGLIEEAVLDLLEERRSSDAIEMIA